MARVVVIFTGGTIAMREAPDGSGATPSLRGEELLVSVPGLDRVADLEPIDWGLVPASHLTFEQVLDIGRLLDAQLRRTDVDGAVIVQGTDVMEETAFAWDLLPMPAKPVVVVGAMRTASQEGYDGPANLRSAVAAASDPRLATQGVVVAMAGELHAADDVRKIHTHVDTAFGSPNAGPIGTVAGGRVRVHRQRTPARLPRIPTHAALPVPVLTAVLEGEVPRADALGSPAGVVVAATGGGNTTPELLALGSELLAQGVPVALATRCPSGAPRPGYGFPGGSSAWWASGAVFSGTLGPLKTRMLLALAIGSGMDIDAVAALCEPFGGGRVASA